MKNFAYIILLISLMSCDFKMNMTVRLDEIDSLVASNQYDSAYARAMQIARPELTTCDDSAHYHLLLVQTSILTHHPDTLMTLDSLVIPHYIKVRNHEKLAEAYYYKAYRKVMQRDIPDATLWYKRAEEQALSTKNYRLQYKIAESLAAINELMGNHTIHLNYAHKALDIAKSAQNKEWMAYSLCRISIAHSWLNHRDSAAEYMNRAMPYFRYVNKEDRPTFLANAANALKHTSPETAKKYLMESLAHEESSVTMQHLADIYRLEGNLDKAYQLWVKALTINDGVPKDNVLQNILEYDFQHGHSEHVYHTVKDIIHIKDSMLNSLRNDSIKDLQLRFDHEVAMRQQEHITGKWQKGVLITVIILLLLVAYIIIRRILEKNRMQEVQMQINDYMNQIRNLEVSGKESDEEIAKLNKQIRDYLDDKAPDLLKGCMYYEQIKADMIKSLSIAGWKKKDEQLFIDYYTAIDYRTVNRLKKTKRREKLTTHHLFFLLLQEMGKSDKYIAELFGINERSVDTLKSRTKPID